MSSPAAQRITRKDPVQPLSVVAEKSERIKESVEECADELSSVNSVLKDGLEKQQTHAVVEEALQRSETIEGKVQDCADELTHVNQALMENVAEREVLEHELDAAKAQEQSARHAALHDPLTELPNRMLFEDRLEHGLAQAKRHNWSLAVMFIDLDGFKGINDTHGHAVGDQILQTIARRLKNMTREDDTVSRYGGDEFLYVLGELKKKDAAAMVAQKICHTLSEPCAVTGSGVSALSVKVSIGIALYPADGLTADALVKGADKAMYQAKKAKSGYAFFAKADSPEPQLHAEALQP